MDPILLQNLIKLGIAVLIGGIVGAEREFQDKAAGFRTIILITVGSTLFTIFSLSMDPGFTQTRIAANIVTGIGFLGAGAIVRERGKIGGLTTAATIWLSAALGMGIGAGELIFVSIATLVIIVVLLIFPYLENKIDRVREARTYQITFTIGNINKTEAIQQLLRDHSLFVLEQHLTKSETTVESTWRTIGTMKGHKRFVEEMLTDQDVRQLTY